MLTFSDPDIPHILYLSWKVIGKCSPTLRVIWFCVVGVVQRKFCSHHSSPFYLRWLFLGPLISVLGGSCGGLPVMGATS